MDAPLKLLLVDDDAVDRMAVRRALQRTDLAVEMTEVETCAVAIELLRQQPFDCVFLDYRLPDGDGLSLVQQVRQAGISLPLIVLTSQGDEQVAVELMKAGAYDYFSKSRIAPQALSRSLTNAVRIHRAEQQAAKVTDQLRQSEERYRLVLDGSNDGIWDWYLCQNEVFCNDRLFEIIGIAREDFSTAYDAFYRLIHPDDRTRVLSAITAHLEQGENFDVECRLLHASGDYRYCAARGKAIRDSNNKLSRMSGIISDITDRKRGEVIQQLLAEASSRLSGSLDVTIILSSLAELTVPFLGDCCFFDTVTSQWRVKRVAWRHADPSKQEWFSQIQHYTPEPDDNHPLIHTLSTRHSLFVPEMTNSWLQNLAVSPEHLQFLQELQPCSLITVPLIVHDQALGALTFYRTAASRRHYSLADLTLAEELAQRAALAVDNAYLYRVTQEAEQNLRRALVILGEHQEQLRTLQRLTDLLNQRLTNLPELLQVMVDTMCSAIPKAEFCLIVLQNPYTGLLELTAATGTGTELLQLDGDFAPGEGLLGEIFQTGEAQLIRSDRPGPTTTARPARLIVSQPEPSTLQRSMATYIDLSPELPASICAVPIASPEPGRLGVLAIGNWSDPDAFDADDQRLLGAFGEQAAIALTNAQLISALEEREERLEIQNRILGEQNRELERQRHQIELQNLQLREAAQLKSQFIATMSHELRTPMTAVIGFSQLLLRQNKLQPQQKDMVERILNNGKNLLALINDILDLSKIEAGRLQFRLEQINLEHLARSATEELRSLAQQKNLPLSIEISLSNPIVVNDSTRLRQVLVNLLSNAIKFTETGCVRVIVEELDSDKVSLTVLDTGIGIAKADLQHIFEEFRQADQGLSKRFAGTGLGLSISDLLIRLMHGRILVESELGKGSMFRVE
ncbi:response regulator, partial [Leptolyngbya sp. FACHB-36]|uniref:ATP-binding protein n=1 Tax=Leptolyngbya sp. FACHB-36 TaxID=2692808 RepID=UPI001681A4A0